jgi:hypothetical protein
MAWGSCARVRSSVAARHARLESDSFSLGASFL